MSTATKGKIPSTREDAIALLVETDVARWGEDERAASELHHAGRTYGLALNELANRALLDTWSAAREVIGVPEPEIRAAADRALTPADRAALAS